MKVRGAFKYEIIKRKTKRLLKFWPTWFDEDRCKDSTGRVDLEEIERLKVKYKKS